MHLGLIFTPFPFHKSGTPSAPNLILDSMKLIALYGSSGGQMVELGDYIAEGAALMIFAEQMGC